MAKLGDARTRAWNIGVVELRLTPLSASGKATQAHSAGLLDGCTVEVAQESANLDGGFPRKRVDTAIIAQNATVRATLREYSRRNLNVLLGLGVPTSSPADVATTLTGTVAAGATTFNVASGTGIAQGDTLVVYPKGRPEQLSVVIVASVAANAVTLSAKTPLLHDHDGAAGPVEVFNAQPIPLGAVEETKYFGVQVIQRNPTNGRPRVFDFWKGSISSGMSFDTSSSDYGSTELQIEILEPAAIEYDVGGELAHLSDIIPSFPSGRMAFGADI